MKAGTGDGRPYCTCVEVRNYDYDEAAEKLGCKRRFLEDRISTLPRQKLGESVAFCDCELRIIQQMFTVIPDTVRALIVPAWPATGTGPEAASSLRSITPSGAIRKTAVL